MSLSVRWNRLRYGLYAPFYDRITRPLEAGRRRAVDALDLRAGERLLIVGCGTGADLEYVPRGVAVTAVDVAPAMVRRTEARGEALGLDVDARVMDARALSFDAESFDAATLHLVLAVVPEPDRVVNEVARVLAPGGRASVFDKFVDEGGPSPLRRAVNPLARLLFSDLTRRFDPLVEQSPLRLVHRTASVGGLYTVALVER